MPYKSDKQRRFFHTDTARKKGITPAMVMEHDDAEAMKNAEIEYKERGGLSARQYRDRNSKSLDERIKHELKKRGKK